MNKLDELCGGCCSGVLLSTEIHLICWQLRSPDQITLLFIFAKVAAYYFISSIVIVALVKFMDSVSVIFLFTLFVLFCFVQQLCSEQFQRRKRCCQK